MVWAKESELIKNKAIEYRIFHLDYLDVYE